MTTPDDLFEHAGADPEILTRCRVCGRNIGNYYAARVAHGRAHVRKQEAVEHTNQHGHIGFRIG